eukprot:10567622-Karenia_brevis.AAC.1
MSTAAALSRSSAASVSTALCVKSSEIAKLLGAAVECGSVRVVQGSLRLGFFMKAFDAGSRKGTCLWLAPDSSTCFALQSTQYSHVLTPSFCRLCLGRTHGIGISGFSERRFVSGSWSNAAGIISAKSVGLYLSRKGGCASVSSPPASVSSLLPQLLIGGPL